MNHQIEIIKFKRKCSITGQGMDMGWYSEPYGMYFKYEEDVLRIIEGNGYKNMDDAFENEFIYYTDWSNEEDIYYSYFENGIAIDLQEWENFKNLKTLVIHPYDETTLFLKTIYQNKGWDVIDFFVDVIELESNMEIYDRIIAMAHGNKLGLLCGNDILITDYHSNVLSRKNITLVWCNADLYAENNDLKPNLVTGMIVSEVSEAHFYGLPTEEELINESNTLFAQALEQFIEYPYPADLIKSVYKSDTNPIIKFNHQRIFSENPQM